MKGLSSFLALVITVVVAYRHKDFDGRFSVCHNFRQLFRYYRDSDYD